MLKYIPIIAGAAALWFLITTIISMTNNNTHTTWQIGVTAVCLIVLMLSIRHAYITHH